MCWGICLLVTTFDLIKDSPEHLLAPESAFFNIFVTVLLLAMLRNPNKPIDLLFCTVPQKYFIFIALWLSHFVLSYDWVSIAAVIIVGLMLHFIRHCDVLGSLTATIERVAACGASCKCFEVLGYISVEQAEINASSSTDDLVAFDRRQIKGHVRNNAAYR